MEKTNTEGERGLDERLKAHPQLAGRLHQIVDELDLTMAKGGSLDEAEERVVALLRKLGLEVLEARARRIAAEVPAPVGQRVHRHSKKSVRWLTGFGWIEVQEQVWQVDKTRVRPFCEQAGVICGGSSRRVQRALTDFGADEAFATAAQKFAEHYGVEVSVYRTRQVTYKHARKMVAAVPAPNRALPGKGARVVLAEADGCMMPTVTSADAPPGADRRKHRKTEYKEIRLVAARDKDSTQTHYAATMEGVEAAGNLWENTTRAAGRGMNTFVHGLGDGAIWIAMLCLTRLGPDVRYTVDLFHVCDYLAAVWPGQPERVHRQRDHLKAGALDEVLAAIRALEEPVARPDDCAPARAALRYLENRREQLNYQAALAADLPIGSGLIESGNRHVLQRRLKQAGAWWLSENLHIMACLRTSRASRSFDDYWSRN